MKICFSSFFAVTISSRSSSFLLLMEVYIGETARKSNTNLIPLRGLYSPLKFSNLDPSWEFKVGKIEKSFEKYNYSSIENTPRNVIKCLVE